MSEQNKPQSGIRESLLYALDVEGSFGVDRLPSGRNRKTSGRNRKTSGRNRKTQIPLSPQPAGEAWDNLGARVDACTACVLHKTRTLPVFGEGDQKADLMFVGEAPGRDEDLSGRPFVDRAGQLLTRMIGPMGFERSQVFIANIIKCRPPQNRTPAVDEIAHCIPYLEEQIAAIEPRVIVALGSPAARTLLATERTITALRGRVYPYPRNEQIAVVPTFHPAYLLRNAAEKPKTWNDLKLAIDILGSPA